MRLVVPLILVLWVLLTRSVALGHSHIGGQPEDHDSRPHWHVATVVSNLFPRFLSHTREDHHQRHHHEENAPGVQVGSPLPGQEPITDHDGDAFHLASIDLIAENRAGHATGMLPLSGFTMAGFSPFHFPASHADVQPRSQPPPGAFHCPLHIRKLTLLI